MLAPPTPPPTPIDPNAPPLVIFGCGYVGRRLARTALLSGRPVRACARHLGPLEPLRDLGAELLAIDATRVKQFGPALHGTRSATVVYSIPPPPGVPAGESVRRATAAALQHGARGFIYLGSSGLYGTRPDLEWIDEDSSITLDDPQMAPRVTDESAVQSAAAAGLRTVVLRLAAVYGPGRGVRKRLLGGDYKLIDGGEHFISRIHVDDLVQIILAADERAPGGAVYLVGDDRPTLQKEHALWLAARLGLPDPPSVPAFGAGTARQMQRGRRIRNERLKRELGVTLLYPSYVEGEAQIEAEAASVATAAQAAAATALEPAPPAAPAPSPPAAPTANPDLALIRALLERLSEGWRGRRWDEVAPLLDEHVVFVSPGFSGRTVGRAACVDSYRRFVESATLHEYREEAPAIDVQGGTAVATSAWEMLWEADGTAHRERGHDLLVLARGEGNRWRVLWRTVVTGPAPG